MLGGLGTAQESVWKGSLVDFELLCWHGWRGLSRNDQAVHYRLSGQVVLDLAGSLSSRPPFTGRDFPLPLLKQLELSGCIVSIDAMGCQTAIAKQRSRAG